MGGTWPSLGDSPRSLIRAPPSDGFKAVGTCPMHAEIEIDLLTQWDPSHGGRCCPGIHPHGLRLGPTGLSNQVGNTTSRTARSPVRACATFTPVPIARLWNPPLHLTAARELATLGTHTDCASRPPLLRTCRPRLEGGEQWSLLPARILVCPGSTDSTFYCNSRRAWLDPNPGNVFRFTQSTQCYEIHDSGETRRESFAPFFSDTKIG